MTISMYALGMSTREITRHVRELYGIDVSPDLISTATGAVLEEVAAWQTRSLDQAYPLVFFDAIRVKIRVEDDPGVRFALEFLPFAGGHRVISAKDGPTALALLDNETTPPDLILTDYHLPGGMNGIDVLAALRSRLWVGSRHGSDWAANYGFPRLAKNPAFQPSTRSCPASCPCFS